MRLKNLKTLSFESFKSASANKSIPLAFLKFQSLQYVAVQDNADYCEGKQLKNLIKFRDYSRIFSSNRSSMLKANKFLR